MINWTFIVVPNSLPLKTAPDLERFFSLAELEEYHKFKVPKRKKDWLNSRLVVKRLVAKVLSSQSEIPMSSVVIRKMDSGVPFVEIEGSARTGWLSLSHSYEGVLAAFSLDDSERFGVDLEHIESRTPELVEDYFTPAEINWIYSSAAADQVFLANLVWSAKEAFLKAIEKGLQLDTRKIEINPFQGTGFLNLWNPLAFSAEHDLSKGWQLFFRREADYVLTICTAGTDGLQFVELDRVD